VTRLPRHLVHRGTVPASAFLLEDTPAGRATLLRRWRPGHEVHRLGARLLWRLPEPQRIACDAAAGLPLVEVEGRLVGAPFELAHVRAAAVRGEVLFVDAGVLVAEPPGERIDVSTYIDLEGFTAADVASLGDPPPPPALALVPVAGDPIRAALGLSPLSAEARDVMEAMQKGAPPGTAAPTVGPIGRALVRAMRWLSSLLPGGTRPGQGTGGQAQDPAAPPRRWAWLDRFDRWLDRVLDVSRLASLLGRRQAEYLNRLMDMFEQGDLDQALRHAIPLAAPGTETPRRSLGLPSPRSSLDIPLGPRRSGGGTIMFGGDAYEQLRRRYRAAAKRLEDQGRYAEAAFVLAELLRANDEAVAMLEKHAQYRLAAELAESRDLPAGLQVRLWFLAKDLPRAIAVARRHGAFGDAILRLERSGHADAARQLRMLWADGLASAGDYQNAVMAIWPLEQARALARKWIDLGIEQGGAAGARLRVKKLALTGPNPGDEAALRETLETDDAERSVERLAIALALTEDAGALGAVAAPLAREAVRSGLRDGLSSDAARTHLLALAGDGALKADVPPPAQQAPRLHTVAPPIRLEIAASDRGAMPVHEAAWLPDGKMLLALGEAGARLVNREGRTAAHFDVPAHRIVTYDSGSHALLLAPRASEWSISRLDLVQRRVELLGQLRLLSFADDTDGSLWIVSEPSSVSAIDLQSPQLKALWRVTAHGVYDLARNASSLSLLFPTPAGNEWWRYELPSFTLRVRQQLAPSPAEFFSLTAAGHFTGANDLGHAWVQSGVGQPITRLVTGLEAGGEANCSAGGEWSSVTATHEADSGLWQLFDWGTGTVRWTARFERMPNTLRVRMRSDVATWADEYGRVLAVDLGNGRVLRDLRVR
jgi:hypothetical protein